MSKRTSTIAATADARPPAQQARSQAVVVLGMHRSGTSAFGGAIARLGVDFGERLARPAKDNQKGFWEHLEIVELHDKLLASLGSSWDSDAPLPADWVSRDRSRETQAALAGIVERDFADQPLFGFKDPRISRLLPLWFTIFEQLKIEPCFVLMVRHPWEVAESLLRRNGIVPSKALLLWLRYTLEAERATRGRSRAIVSYTQLLEDPPTILRKVWQNLNLAERPSSSFDEGLGDFLEGSLRHHRLDDADRQSRAVVPEIVLQTYEALLDSDSSPAATKRISRIGEQLEAYSALFQPRIQYLSDSRLDSTQADAAMQYAKLQEDFDEKVRHVEILQADVEERRRQVLESRQAFEDKVKHLGIVQQELDTRTAQLKQLQDAFEDKARHVSILERELEQRAQDVQRALVEKASQVDHSRQQADRFREQAEQQGQAIERLRNELHRTEDQLHRASTELMDLRWETLTARADALRDNAPGENHAVTILEWENRAQIAEKQCDHLREMLQGLQTDLEEQQAARELAEGKLKANSKQLRFYQKQMARLREMTARRVILPFGRAHRRIQQLTVATRADD